MKAGTVVLFTLFLLVLAGPPVECGDTSSRPRQDWQHWQPKDWQHWQPKELKREREQEQERYWQLKEQGGRLARLGLVVEEQQLEANQEEQQKLLAKLVLKAKPMPVTMPMLTTEQLMNLRKDEAKLVVQLAKLANVANVMANAKQQARQLVAKEQPMQAIEAKQQAKLQELELLQLMLVLKPAKLEAGWPVQRKLVTELRQLELEGSQLKLTQEPQEPQELKGVEEKTQTQTQKKKMVEMVETQTQTLALAQTQTLASGSRHKTIILGLSTLTIFSGLALLIFWILEKQRESSQTNIKG